LNSLAQSLELPVAQDTQSDELMLAGRRFRSRLIVGTGKYRDFPTMQRALKASGAQMVTVAVRRLDLSAKGEASLLHWIPEGMELLPNTAGCFNADDAVRTCRLARELQLGGENPLVKLEVLSDTKTLLPDAEETLKAARILVKEGFQVLPYTNDDPVLARKLEEAGCAAVMPLGAPIGSGLGLRNPYSLAMILEQAKVPVIVDAGVGTASDVAVCMEMGVAGLLVNTAISGAQDPVAMAQAMKLAIEAGRLAFRAGRIPRKLYGSASSPLGGVIGS
jgi:thiazole synthase